MSFSSLPPELVLQIIESTVPHTFHSTTYTERQSTLCSLSLVSTLFRSIAQPLLHEIVKLDRLDTDSLPVIRSSVVRWLIVDDDYTEYKYTAEEEKERLIESLRVLATAAKLTLPSVQQRVFETILSISSHCIFALPFSQSILLLILSRLDLTYLQLSDPDLGPQKPIYLPNLCDLTLYDVSSELFIALMDPQTVPNLRNLALVDGHSDFVENLLEANVDRLLHQLETLTFDSGIWLDPRAAFLHSAASRTLVDFNFDDTAALRPSNSRLRHVRIRYSSLHCPSFNHKQLQAHLDLWLAHIKKNSSLPLESIYLDSSLQPLITLPGTTQAYLKTFTRVCQENKIDLVFDRSPMDYTVDPYISREFVRRQKEQRSKEERAEEEENSTSVILRR
ncbi:hypothetical protein JCM3765_004029 [Sporobolomyces pararoseus]